MTVRSYRSYLTITSICQALRVSEDHYVYISRSHHDFMARVKHVTLYQLPGGNLVTSRQLLRCNIP